VLNDVGPVLEESGLAFILTYLGRAPDFESFAAAGDALARLYAESFPGIDRAGWEAYARRTFAEEAGRPTLSYDPRLREAVEAAMAEPFPDLWPLYAVIGCPILALRGANSGLLSAETLAEMTARHAATTAVTVPDRGHVPFLDEPAVLAALLPFLEAHAP
ncbi:MAG: alpha/beta fold hydrolase, partial [Pseudomonadota bacterium]